MSARSIRHKEKEYRNIYSIYIYIVYIEAKSIKVYISFVVVVLLL